MKNKEQNIENYIEQATSNVTEDRAATKSLLMSLMKYMQTGEDRHRELGLVAAKYLETLQRSNEQLVKLTALIQRKETKSDKITEEDRQELFDLINDKGQEESD